MRTPLYRFLHSRPVFHALIEKHGCGWFDGGCLILAQAVRTWTHGELAAIRSDSGATFDHAVIAIKDPEDRKELLFIDADGVFDEFELLEKWRRAERLQNPRIERRFRHPFQDRSLSRWLAKQLSAKFGAAEGNLISRIGRACLTRGQWFQRYPRVTAHVMSQSQAFCTPHTAGRIVADAAARRQSNNEWAQICFRGDASAAVSAAVANRHYHLDLMSDYSRAKAIVRDAVKTTQSL
jgi:hypothetical protein